MDETRRRLIAFVGLAPVALLGARQAFAQDKPVCYDPSKLPLAQKNMRRTLGFVDPAPAPAKRCGTCAFFTPTKSGCGSCAMLSGGPVPQTAYCTSYAPKS